MQKTYTLAEVLDTFFPDMILEFLGKDLCKSLGVSRDWNCRISPNEKNPATGLINIASGGHDLDYLASCVSGFYTRNGYEVEVRESKHEFPEILNWPSRKFFHIDIQRGEKDYDIMLSEDGGDCSIYISESLFSRLKGVE
jgi:hypothetical protein